MSVLSRYESTIIPAAARFAPGDELEFRVLPGRRWRTTRAARGALTVSLIELGRSVASERTSIGLTGDPGETRVRIRPDAGGRPDPGVGPRGMVVLATIEADGQIERFATAAEVAHRSCSICRYAFLTDFAPGASVDDPADRLLAVHATHVQFYDWMYRHDDLVSGTEVYDDPLGRSLSLETIRRRVDALHARGIEALAYGAVYGASRSYFEQHPEDALYRRDGSPHSLVDWLIVMNPASGSPWRDHLLGEYRAAQQALGFDGIHMDTYGKPKRARTASGAIVDLESEFRSLVTETAASLCEANDDPTLIFNAVNNWPSRALAGVPVRAPYVEVWPPNTRYRDLRAIAAENRLIHGKTPILAVYLTPFTPDLMTDSESERDAVGALLYATAVIASSGATHLVLGEEAGVLCHPYYVDHGALPVWAEPLVRRTYDFLTAYGALLLDIGSVDLTLDHAHGPDDDFAFSIPSAEGIALTAHPLAGGVWAVVRETPYHYVIACVNLSALEADEWNRRQPLPEEPVRGIRVSVRCAERLTEAYSDSPDPESFREAEPVPRFEPPAKVELTERVGREGPEYIVDLPPVLLWRLVWLRKES